MFDFGDVDSVKWMDYAGHRAFPLSLGYRIEASKLQPLRGEDERRVRYLHRHDTRRAGRGPSSTPQSAAVIPNGVNLSYFLPRPENPRNSSVIAFLSDGLLPQH